MGKGPESAESTIKFPNGKKPRLVKRIGKLSYKKGKTGHKKTAYQQSARGRGKRRVWQKNYDFREKEGGKKKEPGKEKGTPLIRRTRGKLQEQV